MDLYVNEDMAGELFMYLDYIHKDLIALAVVLCSLLLYLFIHNIRGR